MSLSFASAVPMVCTAGSQSPALPARDREGRVTVWYKLMTDIDDRKRAEDELENALEEIKRLKDRLHDENVVLREQIDQVFVFEEIVGSSPALKAVFSNIMKVAPTQSERATDSARANDCSDCERLKS
jgi:transcriptional regulator with PAS, ATPase and Fis domain